MPKEIVWGEVKAYEAGDPHPSLIVTIPKPLRIEMNLDTEDRFIVKTRSDREEIVFEREGK